MALNPLQMMGMLIRSDYTLSALSTGLVAIAGLRRRQVSAVS